MDREPIRMLQPWRCEGCQARGVIEHQSDDDSYVILKRAAEAHAERSPGCPGLLRFTDRSPVRAIAASSRR